ncbi:unnamed protein product [Schistocephalus solidus]|uniref:Transcription initiation factor TFIID subunit 12 n=1 Tax=Schistocephalus solidus TaxID=70667 RepID=A0A183SN98_SCHSO|nr:unnamed protein product [Schistocephalus solidus]
MNTRNDASLPQPTAPNLVFHPSTVTQGALVSVTSGMQMWSQSTPQVTDSSGRFIQLPRQAILMTNIAGAANSTASGTNTSASSAFIRTPVSSIATASPGATPLIFAASTPDGTALVRAPLPTQLVTSQLAPSASATPPLTSFVLGTPSGTPTSATVVVSNVGTPAVAAAAALTTSSPTQPAPIAITSSHSASAVLDQAQPPPSSPMPKVVSFQSVAVESPGSQTVTPTPPSQDSTAAEVAPPAPTQVHFKKISIVSVCAPASAAEQRDKKTFYSQLQALVERIPRRDLLIVAEDWNGRAGRVDSTKSNLISRFGLCSRCENDETAKICGSEPSVTSTGFQHRNKHLLTWYSNDGHGSAAGFISVYSNSDASQSMVFTAKSLSDLVKETDPDLQLDDETEEALMQLSEEFVENVAEKAIRLAIHRGSPVVEAKDVKFTLDRDWNIFVPGFPSSEKTWKRPFVLQAHKQRLAYAKKQLKRT